MIDPSELLAGAPWGLVTFRPDDAPGEAGRPGVLAPSGVETPAWLDDVAHLDALFSDWDRHAATLRAWEPAGRGRTDVTLRSPMRRPSKLVCAGANYLDHIREMGIAEVPPGNIPYFFLLPPSSIVGPDEPIRIPTSSEARVDWEAELGVVIGRGGRDIPASDALDHVAGYVVVNDVSSRGLHRRPAPLAPPFEFDWIASKGLDSFSPVGPCVVPSWLCPDPTDMPLRLWCNGELQQDGSTRTMIAGVAELIAAASRLMSLEPGDLIETGTPPGVGAPRGLALADGDEVRITIDGVGTLISTVVADEQQAPPGLGTPRMDAVHPR